MFFLKFTPFTDIKTLWFFFKPHQRSVFAVMALMITASLLESINVVALYPVINYGLKTETTSQGLKLFDYFLHQLPSDNLFLSSCVFLLLLTIVSTVVKICYHFTSNKLIKNIVAFNQLAIFEKLKKAEYKFFVNNQQGRLIYAGTVAPIAVSQNVFCFIRLANSSFTIGFFCIFMTVLAWQGMVFMVILGLFYMLFIRKILNHFVTHYAHLNVQEDEKKNIILNEFISGIKSIKSFNAETFWQKRYVHAVEKSVLYRFKVMLGMVLPDSFLKFIFFAGIAVLGILANQFYNGNFIVLIPLLGTFSIIATRLIPYINLLGADLVSFARFMPDTKVVYHLLNENVQHLDDGVQNIVDFKNKISFENVWLRFEGSSQDALSGVSFELLKGKVTAIIGASGAGKSTIVNLLLRLYNPSNGKIRLDQEDIRNFTLHSYLNLIGYVSQETFIFNGTIKENILFGIENVSDEDVMRAATLANAHDFIIKSDQGYDSMVGDAGMKLSGGQRQRIAIARAMLKNPKILIFDEATSALDSISEQQVQAAINSVSRYTTVVIIAHRLSTIQHADKIIVLENGKVVEEGTHQELVEKKDFYYKLYSFNN